MEFHKATEVFPLPSDEEIRSMIADMRENGQREHVVVHNGEILDGRLRFLACDEIGIRPTVERAQLRGQSPVLFVIKRNLAKRDLNPSQLAMVAARAINYESRKNPVTQATYESMAALTGASVTTIKRARKVLKEASAEAIKMIDSGETTVRTVSKKIVTPQRRSSFDKRIHLRVLRKDWEKLVTLASDLNGLVDRPSLQVSTVSVKAAVAQLEEQVAKIKEYGNGS